MALGVTHDLGVSGSSPNTRPVFGRLVSRLRPATMGLQGKLRALLGVGTALAVLAISGCADPARCEPGLCPSGTSCAVATGLCVADTTQEKRQRPLLRGDYSVVALPGNRYAVAGYAVEQKSLVWVEHGPDGVGTSYLAGPGAGDHDGAEGARSAAVASPSGVPHVVWLRSLDRTVWYAVRRDGKWRRERVDAIPPNRVGARLRVALRGTRPVVAFEDAITGGISVASRATDAPLNAQGDKGRGASEAAGTWQLEALPAPPAIHNTAASLGGSLALSGRGGGLALATYDAAGGDLILASRGPSKWESARFAGRDSVTGADDGDIGLPCALARDVAGQLIVVWRHRTDNAVWMARSLSGAVVRRRVTDGSYPVAGRAIHRRHIIGTALDATVRSDGRIAIAAQDASRARIVVAVETSSGDFKRYDVPSTGRPQVRPHLLARVDGSLVVTWLELEVSGGGAGRLATWSLSVTAETP